ncbi:hypothetical protein [Ectopseudomonas mendocina]|uniref:hypothetical protein n=1 Tax=Ectopseudomonas mendocina TaxID=300 RepID=UPI0015F17BF3|nr:hypothetical protein [Pseudomonas mendocina]
MELHQLILGGLTVGTLAAVGYCIYRDNKRVEQAVKKCQEAAPEPAKPTFSNEKRQPSSVGQVRSTKPSELRAKPASSVAPARRHVGSRHDDDMLNPMNPLSPVSPLHPLNNIHSDPVRSEPVRSEPVSCGRDYDDSSRQSSSWSPSSCSGSSGSSSYDSGSSCSASSSGCD